MHRIHILQPQPFHVYWTKASMVTPSKNPSSNILFSVSKMIILVIFFFFQGLETGLESKKQTSNFKKMQYSVYDFLWEKFKGVLFHLQSLQFTKKCKKWSKLTISSNFWSFSGVSNGFGKHRKTFNVSGDVLLHVYFLQRKDWLSNNI